MTRIFVNLILSLGLTVTFFEKFVELATKAYPFRGVITIGMNPYPAWLNWIIPLNNALGSQPGVFILFACSFFAFIFELFFVAEWNRTKLQTKFPTIATEIPHYCK